jgi:aspartate/methionine/tyrosine aminotransferase
MLADRIQRIGTSATLRISAKAKALMAEGIDVIDLSVGEPDFPTPYNVKEAAKRAIDEDFTKYTLNEGIIELRQAICRRLHEDHQLTYSPDQVIVSCGAKQSLANLCTALLNKGDEVIIPVPYWVSYPPMVSLAKGEPVLVRTTEENGFCMTPDQLKAAISSNTKAVIINNPCNPTGAAYERDQLAALAEIAVQEGLYIIADEIYEKLVYDGFRFCSIASLGEKIRERTILVNGVSKAYSMTGWRIGWAIGPKEIIGGMSAVQSHSTSNANSVAQMASLEALRGPQGEIFRMVSEFQRRRDAMLFRMRSIPGVSCYQPKGAFYLFPNFSAYYNKEYDGTLVRNSHGLAFYLLKHAHVAVVPGDGFGDDKFLRFSYATSLERIEEGMERVIDAVARLQTPKKVVQVELANTQTVIRSFVETETSVTPEMREALVAEADAHLSYDNYYEWNVNIAGLVIQLRTNHRHLYDFWFENFYPAQLEADIEPHGTIYAVGWIPGREPRAYYHAETRTALLFKSAYYAQLRSLAIGMVADAISHQTDLHLMRGFCVDFEGNGIALVGASGTGKVGQLARLLRREHTRLVSDDTIFLRFGRREVIAETAERKFFMKTNLVKKMPELDPLFARSRCENVVTRKEDCGDERCLRSEECVLDRGAPYCFTGADNSYAMLDPYWIGGIEKHVKRTRLRALVHFHREGFAPPIKRLNAEEALWTLERGASAGAGSRSVPFFNPHLLGQTEERLSVQRRHFERLLSLVPFYSVNTEAAAASEIERHLCDILAGQKVSA